MMKIALFSAFAVVSLFLVSCSSQTVAVTDLSDSERDLLAGINQHRAAQGKKALVPSADLTAIAREDASRRATTGGGYQDHRGKTGYEQMLTLVGSAETGPDFGSRLMGVWQKNPIQKRWLEGRYSGVGVGTAVGQSGLETGILLLGGFGGGGV